MTAITEKSLNLFLDFARDAGEWNGTPLIGGNVEMTKALRGNLSDLVQKGLVNVSDDGEGNTWVHFTDAGIALAKENGVDLDWLRPEGETVAYSHDEPAAETAAEPIPDEAAVLAEKAEKVEAALAKQRERAAAKEAAAEKKREANEARLAAGPVRRTWAICATMPNASRKEMIAACVAAGINEATAGTQVTKWRRANPRPAAEA